MIYPIKQMIVKKIATNTKNIRDSIVSEFNMRKSAANDAIRVVRKQLGLYRKNPVNI